MTKATVDGAREVLERLWQKNPLAWLGAQANARAEQVNFVERTRRRIAELEQRGSRPRS